MIAIWCGCNNNHYNIPWAIVADMVCLLQVPFCLCWLARCQDNPPLICTPFCKNIFEKAGLKPRFSNQKSLCDCMMSWKLNDFIMFPIVEWQFCGVFPIFGHTSWKWNESIWILTCRSLWKAGWLKTLWTFTRHGHAVVRPWKVLHHKPHVWWCIPILGPYHCEDWIPRNSTWNTEND